MKRTLSASLAALALAGNVLFAHGDAEHVRGIVTSITDTAITVEVSAKKSRTVTVNAKTMVMKGQAHLSLKEVKPGDRVVLDVDKKTSVVTEVKLAPAAAAPAAAAPAAAAAKRKG